MAKITVVGAGLAGMVTAAILAAEGYEVLVLEREKKIGGSKLIHPSVHTTPADFVNLYKLTGIDFRSQFKPLLRLHGAFLEDVYEFDPTGLYSVERGPRPTSIDSFLYDLCKQRGVNFQFSTHIKNPYKELPKGSILATGFVADTLKSLGFMTQSVYGFGAVKKTTDSGVAYIYFDQQYADDYVYGTAENGIWYSLLFNRAAPLTADQLSKSKELVKERMGLEYDKWTEFNLSGVDGHQLLLDGYILAGTASGTVDPMLGFGIHGAIVSGRPAAMAVRNPEAALKLHNELTKNYQRARDAWMRMQAIPNKYKVNKVMFRYFRPAMAMLAHFGSSAIPGYRYNDYMVNSFKYSERVE